MQAYRTLAAVLVTTVLAGGTAALAEESAKTIRAGMIGLDTSHVIAFTNVFNDPQASGELANVQIVAGFPGGTDIPASKDRVGKYTEELRGKGLEIVDSIPALLEKVDVVLIESVDGRPHLEQARPVIEAGKPLFIDKPVAGSLADAIAIFDLARARGVPCFSSSSLRYYPGVVKLIDNESIGAVVGCATWGPCSVEPHHPDLFWYGVHGVEMLFAVMGTGCETVSRAHTAGTDSVTGIWKDGRIGTYRGLRSGRSEFGALAFGEKSIVLAEKAGNYVPLLVEIAKFFRTGEPPVSAAETIEIFAFMEAADESKRQGGAPVAVAEIIAAARAQNAK